MASRKLYKGAHLPSGDDITKWSIAVAVTMMTAHAAKSTARSNKEVAMIPLQRAE